MGQITIKRYSNLENSLNVKIEYDKEIQEVRYKYVLDRIRHADLDNSRVVYVFGAGGHPRSTYKAMQKMDGVNVICYNSMLPIVLRPLSILIASYSGLVRILEKEHLNQVFEKVVHLSMAAL